MESPERSTTKKSLLVAFDGAWTKLEVRLLGVVLALQILSLISWVGLGGPSTPVDSDSRAGVLFRAALGAGALGGLGWAFTSKKSLPTRRAATMAGILAGTLLAPIWRAAGVDYFENLKAWLQEGSTLTLMGGLRGVATRLTLWLALLGASLATAAGKHIHIDLVFRFLPARARVPVAALNLVAAAAMCFAAVWGFFDHIAIESYGAKADDPASVKIGHAVRDVRRHAFLTRKQIGLDVRSLPRVLAGTRYDRWLRSGEWNAWVAEADFEELYGPSAARDLVVTDDGATRAPFVVAPDASPTRGVLVHDLNPVFPFGLLMIGLRLLLRLALLLRGHIRLEASKAHEHDTTSPEGA